MPEGTPYRLHAVSVVVTAEFHNPSILNPDFLVSREVVPPDWKATEAITTRAFSESGMEENDSWSYAQSLSSAGERLPR